MDGLTTLSTYIKAKTSVNDLKSTRTETYSSSKIEEMISDLQTQLNLVSNKDGKIYGVKFETASSPTGTRTEDAVGLTSTISSTTATGSSDFDDVYCFQTVRVNGYVDADGEFHETAVEGEPAFQTDGSNGDVFGRFNCSYFRYLADTDEYQITDTYVANEGWVPFEIFIRPDKTLRRNAYIACYEGSYDDNGQVASISGREPIYNLSVLTQNTLMQKKKALYGTDNEIDGKQYCGMTVEEVGYLRTLFMIEFATKNSQSIMNGYTNNFIQVLVKYATTDSYNVYIAENTTDETDFLLGQSISISSSGLTAAPDRGLDSAHATVNRKVITGKTTETIDDITYLVLTIDNDGVPFSTTTDMYVSTMPCRTGLTDVIPGHTGYALSNGGHGPMKYRNIENFYGNLWTTISDLQIRAYVPYVQNDCTVQTSTTINNATDWVALTDYTVAETTAQYVKTLGYDENHPNVNLPTEVGGSTTTYWCDYYWIAGGNQEVFFGGTFGLGASCGFACWLCSVGLSYSSWSRGCRISANGQHGFIN